MRADSHFMVAFEGTEPPPEISEMLAEGAVAGVTLFRPTNVGPAPQVAELTARLQHAAGGELPLLVAADQETGQLLGLGEDTTPFPGAMALGATGDLELTRRVAVAVGREMRALGVNLNYAPVCDVATNPLNPSLGIRSFSDDPEVVAGMAAATVAGFSQAGVAATAKHFPGKGEATVDPHHQLPRLEVSRGRLEAVELVPFRSALSAGAAAVMIGHYSVPVLTGSADLPTSVSSEVVEGLLRGHLGFGGVVITDALDMGALPQGAGLIVDALAALHAGVDLLLTTPDRAARERLRMGLDQAVSRRLLPAERTNASRSRVEGLRRWVGSFTPPGIDVVGCAEHRLLAAEVARQSVTLVRDQANLLPLEPSGRLLAVMPRPSDLTPADTSSTVPPLLAESLRRHHSDVREIVTDPVPSASDIAGVRAALDSADVAVIGTIDAGEEQATLAGSAMERGKPVVTVALRTPFDLASYPASGTHLCTYSILPPSLEALAAVLFGESDAVGRLPAAIPGLYPRGHRWAA